MLILQIGVLPDADQGAPPRVEVLDHELSEAVVGVVHFVVEEKGEVEGFADVGHEVVHPIGVNVAQNTLAVEESGKAQVDFVRIDDRFELREIGNVASRQGIVLTQHKLMLMF